MSLQIRSRTRYAFLPAGMLAFLQRRLNQFVGFFSFCLGLVLAASMGTYQPLDPSWNLAIETPVQNLLGYPGAVVADALLQCFGIGAVLIIVALVGWGIRFMFALPLSWFFFRLMALGAAIFLITGVVAQIAPPNSWMLPNSLGGAFGDLWIFQTQRISRGLPLSYIALGALYSSALFLSFFLLLMSLGISWQRLLKGSSMLTSFIQMGMLFGFQKLKSLFLWTGDTVSARFIDPVASFEDPVSPVLTPKKQAQAASPLKIIVAENMQPSVWQEDQTLPQDEESLSEDQASSSLRVTQEDRDLHGSVLKAKSRSSPSITEEPVWEYDDSQMPGSSPAEKEDYRYDTAPMTIGEDYQLPSLDLLDSSVKKVTSVVDPQALESSAFTLKTVLEEYGVRGEIETVRPGPVVTMYELKPAAGIKTSRVIGLADDIARSMSAISTRIAVIPGRNVIGIELPNLTRETVYFREMLHTEAYENTTSNLALILGKDIAGQPVIADLARMPHLLVAGTTGSGKSVAINTMILSLLFRLPPDRCKFIMIDPKMLELSIYDGIPHLLSPVVTDPKKAVIALKWAVREMENRYRAMSKLGVRNIDGYNVRIKEARETGELLIRRVQTGFDPDSGKPIFENQSLDLGPLPYIVVVVDEMADLMLVAGKEIEGTIQRLAQMARAAGIHLIMATQRPSVDVITGTIKANFPTRISFQVTSKIDSRTILGEQGAEQLLGQGDMLYMAGGGRIIRVHGPFCGDHEVERVVAFLKTQGEPSYNESVTEDEDETAAAADEKGDGNDPLYSQAVEIVLREGKASTSFIQRHLQIGYNKAARIIEQMEKNGIVTAANHVGKREILR